MSDSYIPSEDAQALAWMKAFSAGISASPAMYGLTAADANAIADTIGSFDSAMTLASSPLTRTAVTINEKDSARNASFQICRHFAILIKYNNGISDADKIAIGVRPVNNSREPINVPGSSPLINILGATPGEQTLRYADTYTPDSAAKPFGAANLQLFVAVADQEVTDADQAAFYGAFTRNPIDVSFAEADDGKVATYFARWASVKGEVGPWSAPISMRIAA